jgi:hypothetical protein
VTSATDVRKGIHTARQLRMTDFLTLVTRDHHDLESAIDELLNASTVLELRTALDGVRLGLTAHAEAEDIVLYQAIRGEQNHEELERLIGEARSAHLAQESALSALVVCMPGSRHWRDCAVELLDLVRDHASYEETHVIPALRELAPKAYDKLAGKFATERLRQLAMLQPSAPIYMVPELELERVAS